MDPKKTSDQIQTQVGSYLSDFAGQSEPYKDVLSGPRRDSPVLNEAMDKIHSGACGVHDLARAYKHSPHSPPAVLWKYVVHRVNNVDGYNSPNAGHQLDHKFMASVQAGGAAVHNGNVTPRHLNTYLNTNPHLVGEVLQHKLNLHQMMLKESGLNIRKVNGEPYVAFTRGLNTRTMADEMPLSSFGDVEDTGFGTYQHHVWMPLKDLWYGFPAAPSPTRGNHGHENEWLFSNTGKRYLASAKDVHTSNYSAAPFGLTPEQVSMGALNDETAADMISSGMLPREHAHSLHHLGKLGPKTLAVVGDDDFPDYAPTEKALGVALAPLQDDATISRATQAIYNPNLEAQDLLTIATSPQLDALAGHQSSYPAFRFVKALASHPAFNESVASALIDRIMSSQDRLAPRAMLPVIATNAKTPLLSLHKVLIEGLDQGDEVDWNPALTVANCFSNSDLTDLPLGDSRSFNNSANSERYLRALADYFGRVEEDGTGVYRAMLSNARINDTTLHVLTDFAQTGNSLPGTTPEDHLHILSEMARFNKKLTVRQLGGLAHIPACATSIISRPDPLPPSVQEELATNLEIDDLMGLSEREDLCDKAADILLKRFGKDEGGKLWALLIARNPRIPVATIDKYLNHEASPDLANALGTGIRGRSKLEDMVHPLPPGGFE